MKRIDPFCKKNPGAFIEFTGIVTPCCWLITDKTRHNRLQNFLGNDYEKIFITNSKEVIEQAYNKLEQSWTTDTPFQTCIMVCGKE